MLNFTPTVCKTQTKTKTTQTQTHKVQTELTRNILSGYVPKSEVDFGFRGQTCQVSSLLALLVLCAQKGEEYRTMAKAKAKAKAKAEDKVEGKNEVEKPFCWREERRAKDNKRAKAKAKTTQQPMHNIATLSNFCVEYMPGTAVCVLGFCKTSVLQGLGFNRTTCKNPNSSAFGRKLHNAKSIVTSALTTGKVPESCNPQARFMHSIGLYPVALNNGYLYIFIGPKRGDFVEEVSAIVPEYVARQVEEAINC